MLIGNIYGHVTPTEQQQQELGNTLAAFLEHCEAGGAPLAVLTGDMNMTGQEAPLASWLDLCQWSDTSDRPTCLAGKDPRRLDWMIVSRGLQHRVTGRHLRWDTGLATHEARVPA